MSTIDHELVARIGDAKSVLLRALSDAFSHDLQIAPVVVASDPGLGVASMIAGLARSMADGAYAEVRCSQMSESELSVLPVLNNGEIKVREPSLAVVRHAVSKETGSMILLADAVSGGEGIARAVLAQIAREAKGPVVVIVQVGLDQEEQALQIVQDLLDLHRAHVPTALLTVDCSRAPLKQRVLLCGSMMLSSSKHDERYMEMDISEPFDQTVRFTIVAKDDQDSEALDAAIRDLMDDRGPVFARLENVDGTLRCTTDDITVS